MFEDTHPYLFNIAGSKDSSGNDTLRVLSRAEAPRLYGPSLDKDDRPKAVEIVRRLRRAISGQVLRSRDEDDHRLRESSRNQSGVCRSPEWIARSKPSSMIVVGLSDDANSTAMLG